MVLGQFFLHIPGMQFWVLDFPLDACCSLSGWDAQVLGCSALARFVPNPPLPSDSFSISLLFSFFPLSLFSQHNKSPQNFLLASTSASASSYSGPRSHLTAESSSVWIQQKSSLWKTILTLFIYLFSRQKWEFLCHAKCSTWWKTSWFLSHLSWHQQAWKKHKFTFIW